MCGSIEVDVWRARIGLFTARIASRLPKRWRKIKKQVVSMLFTHGVFAGGGACSFGCVSNFRHRRETRLLAVLMSLLLAVSVMNVSLLLRCGDIETNPGPGRYPDLDYDSVDCSKSLGEDDLHYIMSEIITAKARFYAIGRALGLPPGELSSIRSSSIQDHELQLNDVLLLWLRQKYNVEQFGYPTWRKLVETIDNPAGGNDHKLAKIIASRHLVGKYEYRQTLNNFYLRQIDDQAWPPVKVTNFINLALIKGLKSWHETVQGSVDEIVGEKKNIPYQHIFENLDQLKFILFEGRPGSGKSTLMTKISRDWAKGKFLKSKLLFFIPLRRLNTFHRRSLATLIQVACPPFKQDEVESLVGAVQVMNGKNVVFIFDGFDEYSPAGSDSDIILSLMNCYRSYLRDALIVVSSRPAACFEYRKYADKEIEVVGFFKEHISQYIDHYYSDDVEKAQQLLEHLEKHPNLMNMCYLPLHCAMLVFLYDGTAILPKTETEFYKHFTISTLLRSFHKVSGSIRSCLTSFDQLPPKDKILFDKVCKLAYEATITRKQVFKLSELQAISSEFATIGSNKSCLGLVVVDRYFMRFGLDETYTFLHLTFQEFLAAVYMAGLSHSEQTCIIEQQYELERKSRSQKDMRVVYGFLCGMLDFEFVGAMEVFQVMLSGPHIPINVLVQWAYESQSQLPYDYLCQKWNGCIYIDDYVWYGAFKLSDYPLLSCILNNQNTRKAVVTPFSQMSNNPVLTSDKIVTLFSLVDNKALTLSLTIRVSRKIGCQFTVLMEEVQMLQQYCETKVGSVTVSMNIDMSRIQYKVLKSCLKHQYYPINRFELNNKELGERAVQYIKSCTTNLDKLKPFVVIDGIFISVVDIDGDLEFICSGKWFELCISSGSYFHPEDYIRCLCDALQHITYLYKIRMFGVKLVMNQMQTLVDCLKHCINLSWIDLGNMKLNASVAKLLGQSLKHCNEVKTLLLDDNEIGDAGLEALMPWLTSCTHLERLVLRGNGLTDLSVPHLVKLIRVLSRKNLMKLGCYNNDFTEVGRSKLKQSMLEAGGYSY